MAYKYIFAADGSPLQQEAKKSTTELRVMQGQLKDLERQSKATHQEMVLQAKAAGASSEELRKLQQKQFGEKLAFQTAAKQIAAETEADGRKVVKSYDAERAAVERATEALRKQRAEVERLANAPRPTEHFEPSARQKSAALVRGGGLRAAESFAATIPGFASVAEFAFPVVGAIALSAEVARGVAKLKEMRDAAVEAGNALRESFADSHAKAAVTIDDLTIQADKLQDNIDKLHGHPGNGLQTALDEARRYADRLKVSLGEDRKELEQLLKEHEVGKFDQLLSGVASTGKQKDELLADHKEVEAKIDAANSQFDAESATAKNLDEVKDAGKRRDAAIVASLRSTVETYRRESQRLKQEEKDSRAFNAEQTAFAASQGHAGGGQAIDNSAKIANVEGVTTKYQDLLNVYLRQARVNDLTDQNSAAEQAKERARIAKEGSTKALEAMKEAAAKQRKQWDDDFAEWAAARHRSETAVALYWAAMSGAATVGSDNYSEAQKKSAEALRKVNEETYRVAAANKKLLDEMEADAEKRVRAADDAGYNKIGGQGLAFVQALQSQVKAQQDGRDALQRESLQWQVATGQISKGEAAYALAAMHAQQYARALDEINQRRAGVGETDPERDRKLKLLDTEQEKLDAQNALTVFQDTAALAANTWQGALKRANGNFVQDSRDAAKQVADLYGQVLGGINSDLAGVLQHVGERGHRHLGRELGNAVGGTFRGIGGSLANMGLQRVESSVLSKFGVGKVGESRQRPIYTYVVNPVDGKGSGSLLPSPATITGMVGKPSGDGMMQGIGGIAADAAMSFLPGGALLGGLFGGYRALGGGIDEGKGYIVGEKGPEWFSPGRSGYITPNSRLPFGSTIHFSPQVDARGSNDPAAVEAAVHRGIAAAAPHIVSASLAAHKEQAARRPSGSR